MKSRLALPLTLLLLLVAAAWIVFGNPSTPEEQDPVQGVTGIATSLRGGSLSGSQLEGTDPGDPQRIDWTSSESSVESSRTARSSADALASFHGRVEDQAGQPVAGVTVQAYGLIGWAASWNGDPSRLVVDWEATTDEDGRFAFPETPRDRLRFLIEFHHPAFAAGEVANQPATVGRSRDLGIITLGPGFRLHGTVFDANGSPLADAEVTPFRDSDVFSFRNRDPGGRPLSPAVTTDASGNFTLDALPDRSVRLKAEAKHFFQSWSSSVSGVHGEEVRGIEIHLGTAREVFGVVLDRQRAPIAGARVVAESHSRGLSGQIGSSIETLTDADGRFVLSLPQSSDQLTITVGAKGFWVEERDFDQGPLTSTIEFSLKPIASLSGVVVDENGRAVPAATVSLMENRQGLINPRDMLANAQTLADSDGTFTLVPDLHRAWGGRFTVYAWDDTHPAGHSEMFRLRDARRFRAPDLRIVLGTGFRAFGIVVGPDGNPLGQVRIHLRALRKPRRNPLGQQPGTQRGGDIFAHTSSAADGSFSFDGLATGDYRLEAYHAGFSPAESEDFGLVDRDFEARLQLVASSGIAGEVQGPIQAFRSLRVTASSPGLDLLDAQVDSRGRFLFEGIMPGTWNLQLRDADQDASGLTFVWGNAEPLARLDGLEVPPGGMVPAILQLDLGGRGSVNGTVHLNGQPASDYTLFVLPQMAGASGPEDLFGGTNLARQMRATNTDYAGRYTFAGLQSGDYWVILCRPGAYPDNLHGGGGTLPSGLHRREVLLRDASDHEVDFDVLLGSIAFEVSNPDSGRPTKARLIPEPEDGRRSQSFQLRRQGHLIENLAAGNYLLQLNLGDTWMSTRITVPGQSRATILVELPTQTKQGGKSSTGTKDPPKSPR